MSENSIDVEQLRQEKGQLDKILDLSLDVICTINQSGEFVIVSAAAYKIWGYTAEELIGKPYMDYVYHEDHDLTVHISKSIISGANLTNFENRYIHKDGSLVPMIWSAHWDAEEKIMYCVARDGHEKRKNETALIESEKIYKRLFENNPSAMCIWDFETHRIVACNDEALMMYGYDRDEFLNLSIKDLQPKENNPLNVEADIVNEISGAIRKKLLKHVRKDGGLLSVEVSGHSFEHNGRLVSLVLLNDVTDKEKALLELKENEIKLKLATEIAGLGYWQINLDKGNLDSSEEVYNIWQIPRDSFSFNYEYFLNSIHPDDRQRFEEEQAVAFATTNDLNIEYRILLPDGSVRWVHAIGKFIKDDQGVPFILQGTLQNITSQKLLSLSLEESIQRFNYVTKATSDAIWDWDLVNGTLYWGGGFQTIFGYDPELTQPTIATWTTHLHPDDADAVIKSIYKIIDGAETNWQDEYRYMKADGTYAFVADKGFVIRDEKGKAIRMVGAMRDISLSRLNETALIESNERFIYAAQATSEAIWEWHAKEPDIFKEYGYKDLFGYEFPQNVGPVQFWQSKVHPDDIDSAWQQMEAIKANPKINRWTIEYRFLKSNAEYITIKEKAILFRDDKGNLIRMIGSMRDITEHKKAEADLKHFADDLYKRNKELQQFGYVVSHNLRSPVANIMGIATLLELDKEDTTTVERCTQDLKTSINRLDSVIKDLSEILSITDGAVELNKEKVDLNEILINVKVDLEEIIKRSKAVIDIQSKTCFIYSHKSYLYSIFYNLVGNAIKYRSQTEPHIKVVITDKPGYVLITISDNGIGMDLKKHKDDLFKPYKRFNVDVEGKGLGLFLVKSHVEALNGEIEIDSELCKGTTFSIKLPKNNS